MAFAERPLPRACKATTRSVYPGDVRSESKRWRCKDWCVVWGVMVACYLRLFQSISHLRPSRWGLSQSGYNMVSLSGNEYRTERNV